METHIYVYKRAKRAVKVRRNINRLVLGASETLYEVCKSARLVSIGWALPIDSVNLEDVKLADR